MSSDKWKILIVEARYYDHISDELAKGAIRALEKADVEYSRLEVPGALEIPAAITMRMDDYHGFVALGCVIRGETSHYDIVAGESARALMDLTLEGLIIGNAILTVENLAQAEARAGVDRKDKGGFAANAVLRMIDIKTSDER